MKLFIPFFKCGKLNIRNNRCDFYVQDYKKIYANIIPHFNHYPLQNIKYLDYLDFVKGLELYLKGGKINLKDSVKIISGMNCYRKF